MSKPITNVEDAVTELGALPMPQGMEPRTLEQVEHELDGANLSLYEEELESARLRLALKSAQRRALRYRSMLEEPPSFGELTARVEAFEERQQLRARVAELEAERRQWRRTAHHLAGEVGLVPKVPRDDDPFGLHHSYRVGRDLPETGGAR